VTKEQWIIIGFLAAAFVAGWLARALTGRRDRSPSTGPQSPAVVLEEDLERAVEATRKELDRAIRSYSAALALLIRARDPGKAQADPLADEVSVALQDDAANECMLSVLDGRRGQALSERELDLTDWGFAYGVAWARTRDRGLTEAGDEVARQALRVAETVFSAYAAEAEWSFEPDQTDGPREDNGDRRTRRSRSRR
jgi:hypothetical protein